jgi:hypothetical protein
MTMPWRRALAVALALTAVLGGVLLAGPAQADPVTTGTVTINGDSQDAVTEGKSYSYSTGKGDKMEAYSDAGGTIRMSVDHPGGPYWILNFDAPGTPDQPVPGHSPILVPGTYSPVSEYPGNGTSAGLSVFGGWGCAKVTGSFTVKKAVFGPHDYLQAFDATFVQHCEGVTAALRGEVRITNPPPSPPPPPPPSPSPTTPPPRATASLYAPPTFAPDTGRPAALAGGRAAGGPSTPTPWTDADRARFMAIGLGVIAVVILVVNVVIAVRSRRLRQAARSRESGLAWPATMGDAAIGPWSTDDSVAYRWHPYDPSPPVARRSLPGKVIAVSVVLAVRGMLGLLLTFALLGALQLHTVQQLSLPSWYANMLWLQLGICAGEVVFGLLLLMGKEWPRMLGLSVLWFDIAAAILIMFATTFSCAGLFGIVVDAVLIWMLFWHEVTDWCY